MITKATRVIIQGITGNHGSFHTKKMLDYGTKIVAGVTPGKGGQEVHGVPVYGRIRSALKKHKADWSCIFVPARFAKAAAIEALDAGLNIVMITEDVPVHDTLEILALAKKKRKRVLGPNCPGMICPEASKIGIIPAYITKRGTVGVVSRSGTLTYEIVKSLTDAGIGQSCILGIGGDPVVGIDFIDVLSYLQKDRNTQKIVFIGEIGGDAEESAAKYIKDKMSKPVVAFIAGRFAPEGKQMGHAGAIISSSAGTAKAKIFALKRAGVKVADTPAQIVKFIRSGR